MFALLFFRFSSAEWEKHSDHACSRLRSGGFVGEVDFPTQSEAEAACLALNEKKQAMFGDTVKKACTGIYVYKCQLPGEDGAKSKPFRLCKSGMKTSTKSSCAFFPEDSEETASTGLSNSQLAGILAGPGREKALASKALHEKAEAERKAAAKKAMAEALAAAKKAKADAAAAAKKAKEEAKAAARKAIAEAAAAAKKAKAHYRAHHKSHYAGQAPTSGLTHRELRQRFGMFERHVCTGWNRADAEKYSNSWDAFEACLQDDACVAVGRLCKTRKGLKYYTCMETDKDVAHPNKGLMCRVKKKTAAASA